MCGTGRGGRGGMRDEGNTYDSIAALTKGCKGQSHRQEQEWLLCRGKCEEKP
jgi:hypothetical protein